ncbi:MAG: threonylcarbamoyl-AMP synthase [Syntrophaceae bacterium]|nr:threonylcarbamoyl-AMP synthase [Syntrophaceae bacterium]
MPEILKVDTNISEEFVLSRAADILAAGGIIAYPTETFYGLGADATSEKAIRKIYDLKGRKFHNPISVIIDNEEKLYPLVSEVPAVSLILMKTFWPGPLTIVFRASDKTSPLLTAQTGKIGIRISSHRGAMVLAQKLGHPLTATSANLSGAPECSTATEVANQIGDKVAAIIDLGKTAGGRGSTIIDVTSDPPQILREGVISRTSIQNHVAIKD